MKITLKVFVCLISVSSLFIFQLSIQGDEMVSNKSQQNAELEYYLSQGVMTAPGKYIYLYKDLPSEVEELVRVAQGVMIHIFHAHRHGIELSEERQSEVNIRKVEDMLKRIEELDSRPIVFKREPDKRLVGNCRDFSVFICSLLRYKDIPARVRCGFGTYFTPGMYEDHWTCEYWNFVKQKWIQIDPQLDSLQIKAFGIEFDPLDMPSGQFLTAGEVWKMCQSGKIDPNLCGIFDLKGLWFIRGNLLRDLMALNKLEVLPWDCNELMETPEEQMTVKDYELLDHVADLLTAENTAPSEINSLYESNPALHMPPEWKP